VTEKIPGRKPRADAERNRRRLLDVAKVAFAEKGVSASLEEIARAAGVGIGTLYRHFPTRDALIDEMYRDEGGQLAEAAERLSNELPPTEAMRKWLLMFVDYLANKQIMAEVLKCMTGDSETDSAFALSGEKLIDALAALLDRARRNGDIMLEVEPLDMLCAVAGVASLGSESGWEASAKRLVDIMVAGLRSQAAAAKRRRLL
jgi:AcrR family transcriptional regulator